MTSPILLIRQTTAHRNGGLFCYCRVKFNCLRERYFSKLFSFLKMEFSINDLLSTLNQKESGKDLGSFLKEEIQEGISPITDRVDRLEKKLDLLILAVGRVEKLLISLQPLLSIINNLPFFKK